MLFDPRGSDVGGEFYCNVDRASCEKVGLALEQSTVDWWERQSAEARDALVDDPRQVRDALAGFASWFKQNRAVCVWSQGANFDEPIITAAMSVCDVSVPWKFWNSRCTRTVYDAFGLDPRSIVRDGVHHNALGDALHQARCVQAAFAVGRERRA